MRIDEEVEQKILDLHSGGISQNIIANTIGCSSPTVNRILKKHGKTKVYVHEQAPSPWNEERKKMWLERYWRWDLNKAKKIYTKSKKEHKYRVVQKGERGRLRTPYRPDGKFW